MMNDIENRFIEWHLSMKLCLIAVFISFYVGASWSANTLCEPSEKIVFSCAVNKGRYLSLCASSDAKKEKPYMQYRFGLVGYLEMQYPDIRDEPQYKFFKIPILIPSPYSKERVGPFISYVGFRKGEFSYYVYSFEYQGHEGVAVYHDGKLINNIACRGGSTGDLSLIALSDKGNIELPLDIESYDGFYPGLDKAIKKWQLVSPQDKRSFVPNKMVVGGNGELYVSDGRYNVIKRISGGGIFTYLGVLTESNNGGYRNGSKESSVLNKPDAMAIDLSGNLVFIDKENSVIRTVSASGQVSDLVGVPRLEKRIDSSRDRSSFAFPYGLAFDDVGDLYVLDEHLWKGGLVLRKVDKAVVKTLYVKEISRLTNAYVNKFGDVFYVFNWIGVGRLGIDGKAVVIYDPAADKSISPELISPVRAISDVVFDSNGFPFIFYSADGVIKRIGSDGKLYVYIDVRKFFKKKIQWGALAVDSNNGLYIGVLDEENSFYVFHASNEGGVSVFYSGGQDSKVK